MKLKKTTRANLVCLALGLLALVCANTRTVHAQQIQVTAASPSSTAQGTINLNVKVTGKGFKNGAKAKWFITGTTDEGGVVVNSTTFVSSSEVTANITVSDTAVIANFDIQVLNADGRGGKGTELFAVTPKGSTGGTSSCPVPAPAPTSDTKCYSALPGCLDTTFGNFGLVTTDPSGPNYQGDYIEALAIQNDGKIVGVGYSNNAVNGTSSDFVVVRYNTDGGLDTSFGDPDPFYPALRLGYVMTPFTAGQDRGQAVVLQPDGKIVAAGYAPPASGGFGGFAVARYNSDGTLDSTFANGGKTIIDFASSAAADQILIQSDGKLVVAGHAGAPEQFGLARLNSNGTLDSTFGTGGKLIVNPSTLKRGSGAGYTAAIQKVPAVTGEERIVVGGYSAYSSTAQVFAMMRFKPNGTTDITFGNSGRVSTSFSGFGDQVRHLVIDSSNRIVAAGITNTANSSCGLYVQDLAVARYTQDGVLDPSFSSDGKQTVDIYGGYETLDNGLVIQPDGKILIAGGATSSDNIVLDFALVRFNSDGSFDSSFGYLGNGVVTTDFYGTKDNVYAIALQPTDGKIILSGGVSSAFGLARYWP